jgi:hypothetical protein
MAKPESALRLVLRMLGSGGLLATPFIFLPYPWMSALHRGLGMGPLPEEPIVGYLARSTSAFYAMVGGLLWVVSFDVRRHRLALCYLGGAICLLGVVLFGVDLLEGLPLWWNLLDGLGNTTFGIVILFLACRIGRRSQ